MKAHNLGFAGRIIGPGSCFASPLMIHIPFDDDENAGDNDPMYQRVNAVLQENLRVGPGKARNPFFAQFLALVEQPNRTAAMPGYPVVGTYALPAIHDARDRGPRHTDAPPGQRLLDQTVALALDVNRRSSNQLDRNATFDVGEIYVRGDMQVPRSQDARQMLVTTREGHQKRHIRVGHASRSDLEGLY
jgi:hypothetical protein